MIKVFIPQSKGKVKASVRGFWYSQESKKIYYDYLKIEHTYFTELEFLQWKYKQEALFYIAGKIGCIYHNNFNVNLLEHRIYAEVLRHNLRAEIKEALKLYGGVTIYQINDKYFKEIFYK
jgi:hypothetical protein